MRAILAAIGRALRSAFSMLRGIASMPLRMIDTILGGDGWGIPPAPAPYVAEPEDLSPPKVDLAEGWDDLSTDLMTWCAVSIVDDAPAKIPPAWPRAIREWARGLDRDECDTLMNSEKHAVCAHIRGLFPLAGVRKVQKLEPMAWPPEERVDDCDYASPGFAIIADACSRGR